MDCTPTMQRWRGRWRAVAAECVSKICAAINKEKASPPIFGAARLILSDLDILFFQKIAVSDPGYHAVKCHTKAEHQSDTREGRRPRSARYRKRQRHNICAICDPKITIPVTPQFEKEMLIAYT